MEDRKEIVVMKQNFNYQLTDQDKVEVLDAQKQWAEFIVALGQLDSNKASDEIIISEGEKGLRHLYAYEFAPVVFKPTKSPTFRPELAGALSYFVGDRSQVGFVATDHGFATGGQFAAVRFDNQVWQKTSEDVITIGGHYYFVGADGSETKADFTFAYLKRDDQRWYITTHHSSLPYELTQAH